VLRGDIQAAKDFINCLVSNTANREPINYWFDKIVRTRNVGLIHYALDTGHVAEDVISDSYGVLSVPDDQPIIDLLAKYTAPNALSIAERVYVHDHDTVSALFDAGADVDNYVEGITLLEDALDNEEYEFIKLLLKRGATPEGHSHINGLHILTCLQQSGNYKNANRLIKALLKRDKALRADSERMQEANERIKEACEARSVNLLKGLIYDSYEEEEAPFRGAVRSLAIQATMKCEWKEGLYVLTYKPFTMVMNGQVFMIQAIYEE
jgi:hypothetical protein